jgi:GAF domain-containing protein
VVPQLDLTNRAVFRVPHHGGDGPRRRRPRRILEQRVPDLCRCHDVRVTPAATSGEQLGERLARLARVTAELAGARDESDVTGIVVQHGAAAAGATLASLSLLEGMDGHLRVVGVSGLPDPEARALTTTTFDMPTPASDVVRTGRRVVLVGREEISRSYPQVPNIDRGERTLVCLPLRDPTGPIGAISLSFPGHRSFDRAELDFYDVLADMCAQTLVRLRAQERAESHQAKLEFLAAASAELGSSLDYEATLTKVAQLAVPAFADWSGVDLVRDGRLDRLAVAHVDPEKVQLAQELAERYPADPDAPTGPWHVMRTGRSELLQVTDEMLVASARDEEHLRIARELQLRSAVTVPLTARGRVLGVLSWVAAESGRSYTEEDVAFAEDLGKRAAVAIDNSDLHSQTLEAATRLQHAVLPAAAPHTPHFDVAAHYSPSGRTEVGGDFYDVVPLDDGRVAFFVGDVMGRGVAAAAAMAGMRAAARAYLAVDPTPHLILDRLDRMLQQYGLEQLVTLLCGLADPARGELVVANAGHPPPVVVRASGTCEQLPGADGPPLGLGDRPRQGHVMPFGAGDVLVAFTDGLIERRDEAIDAGQDRLCEAVALEGVRDLGAGLESLVEAVRDPTRDDDVAALALRPTGEVASVGAGPELRVAAVPTRP